ncbi:CBS domain-containing protein [Patescibacteria group bacterium]|nr:CBS domain-containing protein [Patescibacteria group bacterium]
MKVSNVMSTTIDFVNTDAKVKDIARIIFGRGINGVPVCKKRKIVGFISEKDILSQFYPTMQEYADDPLHEGNFEEMEVKVKSIFLLTAEKIMSKNPITVFSNTPLLKAQSIMNINKVGRLPVVNEKKELIGIISKGDIFRAIVGDNLPIAATEEYHDWQARHYDLVTNWTKRLKNEIPDLVSLFKKNQVKDIVDIGFGTGEHDFALAKHGFNVLGVEASRAMYQRTQKKLNKESSAVRKRINYICNGYVDHLLKEQGKFGAAIFMGNAFSHIAKDYKKVLEVISKSLLPKNSVIVFQIVNYHKIFNIKNRIFDTNFISSKHGFPIEYAFLRFYDPQKNKSNLLTLNSAIFDSNGNNWKFRSLNSTPIVNLDKKKIEKLLRNNGFKNIIFYGGEFFGSLFKKPFNPKESDWLNVIASR